jgi:hypothetical protein
MNNRVSLIKEISVKTYRRIEITAFRRRVTIVSGVSGEWPRDVVDAQPAQTDKGSRSTAPMHVSP